MKKNWLAALAVVIATPLVPTVVDATTSFPDKPIRIIVPFTPGGGTDILARQVAASLSEGEKWNVIVENRPGGNGSIALSGIARAPADGYQVVLALRENIVIAPLLNKEMAVFDVLKDFTPIVHIADAPMVVVAGPQSKFATMTAAIDAARSKPGEIGFGTSGQGSMSHLLLAMLGVASETKMTHVPYRGSNPALTDLVGGHVDLVGGSIASAKAFIDSGRARPLAVSSLTRAVALPDVPTIAELGYPGFDVVTWYGFFGPAGMPEDIVNKINQATNKVLSTAEMQRVLLEQGMQTHVSSPAQFKVLFLDDYAALSTQLRTLDMNAQ